MQAAVHGDDLARGLAEAFADEEEVGFGLVGGGDGRLGQRAVGVELREFADEGFGGFVVGVGNGVFREGADDALAPLDTPARDCYRTVLDGKETPAGKTQLSEAERARGD